MVLEAKKLRLEREKNLLEIAGEKSRLKTVINCMADGVLVVNRENKLVLYNPCAFKMLNIKYPVSIGQSISQVLKDENLIELQEEIQKSENSGYSMVSKELIVKDGKEDRTLMANIAPVRDEGGEVLGSVVLLSDITKLKELDRMKSSFISMVSHELRAPIAAIESYLDIMLSGITKDDPERNRKILKRSKERAEGLLVLINDLLDITSMEAGRIARHLEPLNMGQIAHEAVEFMRGRADEKRVVLKEDFSTDLPLVNADRDDMERILINLISNAIKYNREGGSVSISLRPDGNYLCIEVADTGIGIPEADIPHIFDEFYRVKNQSTRGTTGTGLGLSIVKKIVDSYSGFIDVDSGLDRGTTFKVFLPQKLSITHVSPPLVG